MEQEKIEFQENRNKKIKNTKKESIQKKYNEISEDL